MAISAELQILVTAVNRAGDQIGGIIQDLNRVSQSVQRTNNADTNRANQGLKNLGDQANNTKNQVQTMAQETARSLAFMAARIGLTVAAFRQLIELPEIYKTINARLRIAAESQQDFAESQAFVVRTALSSRVPLEGVAGLYSKLRINAGLASETAQELTDAISKATQLDGGGAPAAAAIFQLQQGLASGQLRGDELNAVLEQTPSLAKAIADGMGVTAGALRKIASEGELTTEVVSKAIIDQKENIERQFAQMPVTVGQAFQLIRTRAITILGRLDEAFGFTGALSRGLVTLSENFSILLGIATAAIPIFVTVSLQLRAMGGAASFTSIAMARLAVVMGVVLTPVGLVVAALAVLAGILVANADETVKFGNTTGTVIEGIRATWDLLIKYLRGVWDPILAVARTVFQNIFGTVDVTFSDIVDVVRSALNIILGIAPSLSTAFDAIGTFITNRFKSLFAFLINSARGLGADIKASLSGDFSFNGISSAIETDTENAKKDVDAFVAEMGQALKQLTGTDYVGDFAQEIGEQIARNRSFATKQEILNKPKNSDPNINFEKERDRVKAASELEIARAQRQQALEVQRINAALSELERTYDRGQVAVKDYFDNKRRLSDEDAAQEQALIRLKIQGVDREIALAAQQRGAEDDVMKLKAQRIQLETQLSNAAAEAAENILELNAEEVEAQRAVAQFTQRTTEALLEAQGLVADAKRSALEEERLQLLEQVKGNDEAAQRQRANIEQLIALKREQISAAEELARIENSRSALDLREAEINGLNARNLLSRSEYEAQIRQIYAERLALAEQELLVLQAQAATAPENLELQKKILEQQQKVADLQTKNLTLFREYADAINKTLESSTSTFFEDLLNGTKSFEDAFKDAINNLTRELNKLAAQEIAKSLFGGTDLGGAVTGQGEQGIGGALKGIGANLLGILGLGGGKNPQDSAVAPSDQDQQAIRDSAQLVARTAGEGYMQGNQGIIQEILGGDLGFGNLLSTLRDGFGSLMDSVSSFLSDLFSSAGTGGGSSSGLITQGLSFLGFADGGEVHGPGSATSDSIAARLSDGEFVTRASQTRRWLPLLHAINSGSLDRMTGLRVPTRPFFADGGLVNSLALGAGSAGGKQVHVTVQQNISTPDLTSFRKSRDQIASESGRAVNRAIRRNG